MKLKLSRSLPARPHGASKLPRARPLGVKGAFSYYVSKFLISISGHYQTPYHLVRFFFLISASAKITNVAIWPTLALSRIRQVCDFIPLRTFSHAFGHEESEYHN